MQFEDNFKLMSAFPYWIDSSMTKIIDILYSIISHYIWTIQFALNLLSFMPAIYSYLHRKTINRTKKKEYWFVCGLPIGDGQSAPTADWSIIQFARIQLLCPKAINRTRWSVLLMNSTTSSSWRRMVVDNTVTTLFKLFIRLSNSSTNKCKK